MRQGGADGESRTDQMRVYREIVGALPGARRPRMMVQSMAGTGKSFLPTSIFLWCVIHGMPCKAAAPRNIAAANIECDGSDICATKLHNVFYLGSSYQSSLDVSKPGVEKVGAILTMKLFYDV